MTLTSFSIVMFSAFAVAVLGVLYVRRTHMNALQKREKRRELLKKIESLPLPKMMQALGVGIGRFLYQLPVETIEDSIANCETCSTTKECEQKLKIPELNPEDVEFCNNLQYLSKFSRASRIRNQNDES